MASPFPGMDPYLEGPAFWADFHHHFLDEWCCEIGRQLPDQYDARINETVHLVHVDDDEIQRVYPDVAVTRSKRRARSSSKSGGTLLLEPATIPHVYLDRPRQGHIEILNRADRKIVAILELLSPTNKIGAGFGEYSAKRNGILRQKIHLVELDLLVGGKRPTLSQPLPAGDYHAYISRADRWPDCEVYTWTVRDPLPSIPIPLKAPDADNGGVQIKAGANHNQVDNNIIPANNTFGVDLSDPFTVYNVVQGNRIGTNADGTAALGSQVVCVKIENMSDDDTIGGSGAGQGNLISGNSGDGILSTGSQTADNTIQGNLIGVPLTGNAAIANGGDGIEVNESNDNIIGGPATGAGNIVSGNVKAGIEFDDASTGNTVQGNLIGTAIGGMAAIPNGKGVVIDFGINNTIGGTAAATDLNVIAGNSAVGVRITGQGSTSNAVANNYIGLNSAGAAALPNAGDGVIIQNGATGNTVTGNGIAGNGIDGVQFDGAGTKNNTASENRIGTNVYGNASVPNGNVGASFTNGAADNTVSDNLISGNLYGVSLSGAGTAGNLVQGNQIGTDVNGTLPIANTTAGVQIESGASGNFIGGTDSSDGNVISGNAGPGILITGVGTNGNVVQSNYIGVEADGATPLPNAVGIAVSVGASNNLIGGAAGGNVISGNTLDGFDITGDTTLGNTISANAIYANGGLGIDLGGGVTTNTPGGAHTGPNHLLNYPILSDGATPGTINGSLNSQRNATFTIEFFASPTSDDTEAGQGRDYLGSEKVTTGALGNAFFTFAFTPTSFDPYVTAAATDAHGDTSEFSPSLDAGLSGAGLNLTARAGVPFTGVVATFSSVDALAQASSYTAIIWGDGQSSSGTIVAGPNDSYAVVGSHTYSSPATVVLVAVQIDDILGSGEMETHGMATVLVGG